MIITCTSGAIQVNALILTGTAKVAIFIFINFIFITACIWRDACVRALVGKDA